MTPEYANRHAGLIAASERRAAALAASSPRCRICNRPMVCGQETSNRGRHYVCSDPVSGSGKNG